MEHNGINHSDMVRKLKKPGLTILHQLNAGQMDALHMAVGVSGEAGELLDAVKKLSIYQKPLDEALRANIIEELGDLEFYMEGLRQSYGITRDETLIGNIEKLGKRYKDLSYTDAQAHERADKAVSGETPKN